MTFLIYLFQILILGTQRSGSNKYAQGMSWIKNKKSSIPLQTPFSLHKSGVKEGYLLHEYVFLMCFKLQIKTVTFLCLWLPLIVPVSKYK